MAEQRTINPGELYRHFKGNLYQIVAVANHSETKEKYVVYQALYGDMGVWVRPYEMFLSEVDHNKYPDVAQKYRFEKVSTIAMAGAGLNVVSNQAPCAKASERTTGEPDQNALESVKPSVSCTENSDVENGDYVHVSNVADEEEKVDDRLLNFLDAPTFSDKLNYLTLIRKNIDDRLINDIAASLDLTVDEGDIDTRYRSLRTCIETMARFECNRLR